MLHNKHTKTWRVHKLVLHCFVGHKPENHEINHKNGDKADNRLDNLEYVTRSQNIRHAIDVLKHPTGVRGERHGSTNLKNQDVINIRERCSNREDFSAVARDYGITDVAVGNIARGKTWKQVGGPLVSGRRKSTTRAVGKNNGASKVQESDIPKIRQRAINGESYNTIAMDYGISNVAVKMIATGKTWRHVQGPIEKSARLHRR